MRRYWLENLNKNQQQIILDGDLFHHICHVCRNDVGSQFELLSDTGLAARVKITKRDKKSAEVQILEWREVPALPIPHIHLALSLPKFPTYEAIIEKSVELGVHTIHPFFSNFSFLRGPSAQLESKKNRWEKIKLSATQQTGRADSMKLLEPIPLSDLLENYSKESALGVFAYEGEGGDALSSYLTDKTALKASTVWIFVGSEGGFSHSEVEIFKKFNLFPVSLGQQVLRVETACVTLIGILKYELNLF